MFEDIKNGLANVGMWVRKGLSVIGGGLIGFGIATQAQVDQIEGFVDAILTGLSALVETGNGLIGAVMALVSLLASLKVFGSKAKAQ